MSLCLSYPDLVSNLSVTIHDTITTLDMNIDPVQKELRVFEVAPSPILMRDLLSYPPPNMIHYQHLFPFTFHTKNWRRHRDASDYMVPSANTLNFILQPLYLCGERALDTSREIVLVKCSRRTFVGRSSMSDVIVRRIHKLSQELARVPYLSEFVRDIDPDCYQFMYVRQTYPSYDDFVSTLYEMAISANDSFNDHFRERIRQLHLIYPRRSTIPLKLKSKLYINRADRRAYYVDKDEIRHVCGSIFQWLLQGNKQVREKMTLVTKWIPAMYKNLLNDASMYQEVTHYLSSS